jgi:hypothetical protein
MLQLVSSDIPAAPSVLDYVPRLALGPPEPAEQNEPSEPPTMREAARLSSAACIGRDAVGAPQFWKTRRCMSRSLRNRPVICVRMAMLAMQLCPPLCVVLGG